MRPIGSTRQPILPSLVALTVGLLCVWASQSWAQGNVTGERARLENDRNLDLSIRMAENQCDTQKHNLGLELNELLQNEVKKSCRPESNLASSNPQCELKPIQFRNHSFSLSAKLDRVNATEPYQLNYKGVTQREKIIQLIVEETLQYPCNLLRTHASAQELYGIGHKNSDSTALNNRETVLSIDDALKKINMGSSAALMGGNPSGDWNQRVQSGPSRKPTRVRFSRTSQLSPQHVKNPEID